MDIKKIKLRPISKSLKIISIIVVALMFIRVMLHYLEMGFFEFVLFVAIPEWILFLPPAVILIYRIASKHSVRNSLLDFAASAIAFPIIYYVLTPDNFDKFDWNINLGRREQIVSLAKANKLEHVSGSRYEIPFSLSLFPVFKSDEVSVQRSGDTLVTVAFYTDHGLLDHYSGFVYTNDSTEIRKFDEEVMSGGNDIKLQPNWYLIHR